MKQIYLVNTHNSNYPESKIFFRDKTSDIKTIDTYNCFTIDGREYCGIKTHPLKKNYYQDYRETRLVASFKLLIRSKSDLENDEKYGKTEVNPLNMGFVCVFKALPGRSL